MPVISAFRRLRQEDYEIKDEDPVSKEREKDEYGWEVQLSDRVLVKHRPWIKSPAAEQRRGQRRRSSCSHHKSPPYILSVHLQKTYQMCKYIETKVYIWLQGTKTAG